MGARDVLIGQRPIRAPTVAVRSTGRRKVSIGLAALRAMIMNSSLRHRFMPEWSVGVIVIRETK